MLNGICHGDMYEASGLKEIQLTGINQKPIPCTEDYVHQWGQYFQSSHFSEVNWASDCT